MVCTVKLEIDDGTTTRPLELGNCVSFYWNRVLYSPCAELRAEFYKTGEQIEAESVRKVYFYIDEVLRFKGIPEEIDIKPMGTGCIIKIFSRSYTLLLAQNEPEPGLMLNKDLEHLITDNVSIPDISWESPTPEVRYTFVKERSTVWDAIVAYSVKATGHYPYIWGRGIVRVSFDARQTINYYPNKLINKGTVMHTANILSDVYMADTTEEYVYHSHSSDADELGISRIRYYPLDRQWLYDPDLGLSHKLNYSQRGIRERYFTYMGYLGEELMDRAVGCSSASGMYINSIRVTGTSKGVFTRVGFFDDKYGQMVT